MDEQYEKVKEAVENLSLEQACVYSIYELRESAIAVSAAIRLLRENTHDQEQQKELLVIAERKIQHNLTAISDLLVDRLLFRLRQGDTTTST